MEIKFPCFWAPIPNIPDASSSFILETGYVWKQLLEKFVYPANTSFSLDLLVTGNMESAFGRKVSKQCSAVMYTKQLITAFGCLVTDKKKQGLIFAQN